MAPSAFGAGVLRQLQVLRGAAAFAGCTALLVTLLFTGAAWRRVRSRLAGP